MSADPEECDDERPGKHFSISLVLNGARDRIELFSKVLRRFVND